MVIKCSGCAWIGTASRLSRTCYISGIDKWWWWWRANGRTAGVVSRLAISLKSALKERPTRCSSLGRPKSTTPTTPPIPPALLTPPLTPPPKPLTPLMLPQKRPATNGCRSLGEGGRKRRKNRRRPRLPKKVPQPKLRLHHLLLQWPKGSPQRRRLPQHTQQPRKPHQPHLPDPKTA